MKKILCGIVALVGVSVTPAYAHDGDTAHVQYQGGATVYAPPEHVFRWLDLHTHDGGIIRAGNGMGCWEVTGALSTVATVGPEQLSGCVELKSVTGYFIHDPAESWPSPDAP